MTVYYQIAGRKVGTHVLSMAVLGSLFGGTYLAMSGGSKKENGPPINASSKDEEKFIQEFMKSAEEESKKDKS